MSDVVVHADADALALGTARFVSEHARAAISARGRFAIALAGGSTPKGAYRLLAGHPFREEIDWRKVDVFFGDERCVPPDHPDSNWKMAQETLLSKVSIPSAQVHRLAGERDDLGVVAREAAATIVSVLGGSESAPPRLDLVLLGIGDDGHTASIFPDCVPIARGPALFARVKPASKAEWRLTMTLPLLNAARAVAFVAAGAGKRAVVRSIVKNDRDPPFPAALVHPADGTLTFLLDRAAAADL